MTFVTFWCSFGFDVVAHCLVGLVVQHFSWNFSFLGHVFSKKTITDQEKKSRKDHRRKKNCDHRTNHFQKTLKFLWASTYNENLPQTITWQVRVRCIGQADLSIPDWIWLGLWCINQQMYKTPSASSIHQ